MDAFSQRAQKVISDIGQDCAVLIGIAAQWSGGKNKVETVLQEIEIARQLGVKGIVLFHGKALTDEYLAALKAGPFKEPAAMPTAKR